MRGSTPSPSMGEERDLVACNLVVAVGVMVRLGAAVDGSSQGLIRDDHPYPTLPHRGGGL
jgi:hypothetical protein